MKNIIGLLLMYVGAIVVSWGGKLLDKETSRKAAIAIKEKVSEWEVR